MRIEIIKRLICSDCGSDVELKRVKLSPEKGEIYYMTLCLDCFLDREEQLFKMDNEIEKEGDY